MDTKTRILEIIRANGPVTPIQIGREIQLESYMASAMLSELVSEKQLKISSLKVGSTPLYYLPGQETRLEQFLSNLNEKDRRTVALLRQRKILKDSTQEPLTRVSLRNIKDFCVPLQVSHEGKTELYWKWYSLPAEETENLIKEQLGIGKEKHVPKKEAPKLQKPPKEKKEAFVDSTGNFASRVSEYLKKSNIVVLEQKPVRKNDIDFMVRVPSAVGELVYYCKAKDKKRLNEGDLAAAYVKGENKKLPILFLATGEPTKKAKEMLGKEFKNITLKKV